MCLGVCRCNVSSCVRYGVESSHMFVQWTRWFWMLLYSRKADKVSNRQIAKKVASVVIMWQVLRIMAINDSPMSEKGAIMGRMFVSVCRVCWDSRLLWVSMRAFLTFLMVRCSGYGQARKMRAKMKNVVFRYDHVVSECLWIDGFFFTAEWMLGVEVRQRHTVSGFPVKFCLEFVLSR